MTTPMSKMRPSSSRIFVHEKNFAFQPGVHDDPVTLMGYVTKIFVRVFGYSESKAHRLMMEVHKTGRSVVWTGAREQAEMYAQKLQSHHLLTTLEKVEG